MKQYYKAPIAALAAALLTALVMLGLAGCDNPNGAPAEEETWKVTFNAQGGTPAPAAQAVIKGDKAVRPPDPALQGHTLAGWYTEVSAQNLWDFDNPVTGDLTLYARWTDTPLGEDEWELRFDSQGGPPVASVVVKDGETVDKPTDPVRSGYYFDGWYKEAACENLWNFSVDTVTANITLYAKWTPVVINFTVHFDAQGGTPVPADQIVATGGKATQPTVTKAGFRLDGWGLTPADGPAWDFAVDTVEDDMTLYAWWIAIEENQAVVTFNANDGVPVPQPQAVDIGAKAVEPEDPAKNGFTFDGWFKEQAGLTLWDFDSDTVAADITLYAKWTALYTVTFDSRGGSDVEGLTLRAGSKAQQPDDPVRGPDRFDGWYSSLTDTPWNFDSLLTGSITLYARWTSIWSVTFDSREGGPVPKIEGIVDGDTIVEPAAPTRANNTFAGWHSDTAYTSPWDFAVNTVTANITLYAKWTAVVQFNANGSEPTPDPQTVTSGSFAASPADPVLEGKSFAGWYKETTGGARWDFASDRVTGNMTLHARWEIIPVTKINNIPVDGLINEALDLGAAAVVPANASVKTIAWTVNDPGTTGVNSADPFTPTTAGTLVLTATIQGGGEDGDDYTENFSIKIMTIRQVTDLVNVPTDGFVGIDLDLGGAAVIPANATNKTIVWSVKTPGAGVTSISGSVFRPSAEGTLTLTATIAKGREDNTGNLSNYTQDFTITVHDPASKPGGVGLGEDATIELFAGIGTTPLPRDSAITVAKDTPNYYVRILNVYTNTVWHLNGTKSTATGNRLYLDTGKAGTVRLTVEAESGGELNSGTYVFKIE
jgi:uncharacterized repeat protein (TIGR02543 family)